ncbi:MAG: prolyl oligopeptidase family serine peptidase [Planctomycetes bacterium]|nr:prolyl oligopeptidase family serine peptidase [Planctomycetota bacterium]
MKAIAIFLTFLLPSVMQAQQKLDAKIATLPAALASKTLSFNPDYLVYAPKEIKKSAKLPLVIYLHGAGGVGRDASRNKGRTRPIVNYIQTKGEPMIVVAPQCSRKTKGVKAIWRAGDLNLWLGHLKATLPIDEKRIYLTGTSMGGYGTWMWAASNPKHFAAVAPLCGGLGQGGPKDITPDFDRWAKSLSTVPLWAFHGGKDRVVPADRSERMVKAMKDHGGKNVKLTVYPDLRHAIAKETYSNAEFYEWLFKWGK